MKNFENIDTTKSKILIDSLMKGQIINESIISDDNNLISNPLFMELRRLKNEYEFYFKMSGLSLLDNSNYFYLCDDENDNKSNKLKKKIHASIIILARYIMHNNGKLYEYLTSAHYGIKEEDIDDIYNDDKIAPIIDSAFNDSKNNEKHKVLLDFLKEKGLMLQTKKNSYILSDSGKSLIEKIKEKY